MIFLFKETALLKTGYMTSMNSEFTKDFLANAVAGAVVEAGKGVCRFANQMTKSLKNLKRNYETLKSEVEMLQALRADHEREVQWHKMKTTSSSYDLWLCRVVKILERVEKLEMRYQKERKLPLKKFLFVRHQAGFSDKVMKMYEEVHKLVEEGKFPGGFLVDKTPEHVLMLTAPDIRCPVLLRSLEKILDLLRDENVRTIGIWGSVGEDKRMIMQNLNNHEQVGELFDMVIYVRVSREGSVEKLQESIVRRLGLKIEGAFNPDEVARLIAEELKKKKYLLLLDEVMDPINLLEIGITDDTGNGSKIVVATVSQPVSSMTDTMVSIEEAVEHVSRNSQGNYIGSIA